MVKEENARTSAPSARLPTADGDFVLHLFVDPNDKKEHVALVLGDVRERENVLVRVHSECLTGDIFGSLRCDCGSQLQGALKRISDEGCGVLVYLRQEGRGIGLAQKLRAYNLQDQGYDTVEANLLLGHGADERSYEFAAHILSSLGVKSVRLLSNNPAKVDGLTRKGMLVNERIPVRPMVHPENRQYLKTKVAKLAHLIDLENS